METSVETMCNLPIDGIIVAKHLLYEQNDQTAPVIFVGTKLQGFTVQTCSCSSKLIWTYIAFETYGYLSVVVAGTVSLEKKDCSILQIATHPIDSGGTMGDVEQLNRDGLYSSNLK